MNIEIQHIRKENIKSAKRPATAGEIRLGFLLVSNEAWSNLSGVSATTSCSITHKRASLCVV